MKFKKIIITIALLSRAIMVHADESPKTDVREPDAKVSIEQYHFEWLDGCVDSNNKPVEQKSKKTKYFIFAQTQGKDEYSLKKIGQFGHITKDTYYVKTFGGMFPTTSIDVINNRFIAFPETIRDSSDDSKIYHPMKAITYVYDMKTEKIVFKSEPYVYDHDVPLVYDLRELSFLSKKP